MKMYNIKVKKNRLNCGKTKAPFVSLKTASGKWFLENDLFF